MTIYHAVIHTMTEAGHKNSAPADPSATLGNRRAMY